MSKRGVSVYFNEQAEPKLQYAFERMKAFGLLPAAAESVNKHRAAVLEYVLDFFEQHDRARLAEIEALERNESALESAIEHASGRMWLGEEEQGERAETLEELWDELHETRRALGKL